MIVVFAIIVQIVNPVFLTFDNVIEILRGAAFVFIVAAAATYVLIGGGLDLSVGSVFAAGGLTAAFALNHGASGPVALLAGVVTGTVIGSINGLVIVGFKIPPLIVTLGMIYIARGVIQVLTSGVLVPITNSTYIWIGEGVIGGVPLVILYSAAIGVLSFAVLEHTRFGYLVRAVGGNANAARAVGINVDLVRLALYIISGSAAALAGTLTAARLSSGDPNIAVGYEITVLSAVIIGGTSLFGGVGGIPGTALGALMLSILTNGLIVMRIDPLWQNVAIGVVIVTAVGVDQWRRRQQLNRFLDASTDEPGGFEAVEDSSGSGAPPANEDVVQSVTTNSSIRESPA